MLKQSEPWRSPCGTSPWRRFWPARRCTPSPCKPAPGWVGYCHRGSSSDGRSPSSPAACPRTLEEQFMSKLVHPQQTEPQTSVWTGLPEQIELLLANKEARRNLHRSCVIISYGFWEFANKGTDIFQINWFGQCKGYLFADSQLLVLLLPWNKSGTNKQSYINPGVSFIEA